MELISIRRDDIPEPILLPVSAYQDNWAQIVLRIAEWNRLDRHAEKLTFFLDDSPFEGSNVKELIERTKTNPLVFRIDLRGAETPVSRTPIAATPVPLLGDDSTPIKLEQRREASSSRQFTTIRVGSTPSPLSPLVREPISQRSIRDSEGLPTSPSVQPGSSATPDNHRTHHPDNLPIIELPRRHSINLHDAISEISARLLATQGAVSHTTHWMQECLHRNSIRATIKSIAAELTNFVSSGHYHYHSKGKLWRPTGKHFEELPLATPSSQRTRQVVVEDGVCGECKTMDTPRWRSGEMGEVLCNACWLRWKTRDL
ncbi:uncharacterized protein SPPG_07329 [Spizellomyces punctatus DAOM BR117]|uniref:GATA-type domain-containing protein n=1 Tax=Spizellomyces punctatus (strain DAOM BR117) TaxID=645134 RepID=A0A0L0H9S3_SPIPD|nr:uncharacterized protein SPPG_07329 [Spizellomyces punctatus DAOM BR117]KNC97403.1 hypothetical protein SPPG_07329 [Spizellomyces punctatus DAOM BR117]|eukprot:XP_016605443.1 hypothetical protein SPPG_07329 [Spizellomyces punctatus DAOM BR117]